MEEIAFTLEDKMIEPAKVIERTRLLLAGFSFFGDPFAFSDGWSMDNEIGRLWQRFRVFFDAHDQHLPGMTDEDAMFEVHLEHPETQSKGLFEVFVGVPVEGLGDLPVELVVKVLPSTPYAVFTLRGTAITGDWGREIYQEWLPQSAYREAYPYSFQYYDERFKGLEQIEESILDIYVPVAPRT
jgi:predicted transcriptional regulator YdeE